MKAIKINHEGSEFKGQFEQCCRCWEKENMDENGTIAIRTEPLGIGRAYVSKSIPRCSTSYAARSGDVEF